MENNIFWTRNFEKVDKNFLDTRPHVKIIASPTTGLDHIDLAECFRRGVEVVSLKGETEFLKDIPSVAELTIWFMLELLRWPHQPGELVVMERFLGNQLKGKTVGIIGWGRIGKQVAERLSGFGVNVLGFDTPNIYDDIESCDIISLHIPLEGNGNFFDKEFFARMKDDAILINTSRPQVVNKEDLIWAIDNRSIRYGTDFYDPDLEGLALMTNHIGGYTEEAVEQTEQFIKNKIKKLNENKS